MQRLVWAAAVACVGGFVHPGGGVVRRRAVDVRLTGGEIYETLAAFGAHASQRVVVKYGGHAMSDDRAAQCFAEDIVTVASQSTATRRASRASSRRRRGAS